MPQQGRNGVFKWLFVCSALTKVQCVPAYTNFHANESRAIIVTGMGMFVFAYWTIRSRLMVAIRWHKRNAVETTFRCVHVLKYVPTVGTYRSYLTGMFLF